MFCTCACIVHVLSMGMIGGCLAICSGSPAHFSLMWKRKSDSALEAPLQGSATRLFAKLWTRTAAALGMEWNGMEEQQQQQQQEE